MDKIQVALVIEILGKPADYVTEALDGLVKKLGDEKGVKITNKIIHEPIPSQDSETLFTTFAEVEADLESLENYFGILFAYMPSHIEIITPEKINITNSHLNALGNKLINRLHEYDAITKGTLAEKEQILKKLFEVAPHLFKQEPQKASEPAESKKPKKKPKKKS